MVHVLITELLVMDLLITQSSGTLIRLITENAYFRLLLLVQQLIIPKLISTRKENVLKLAQTTCLQINQPSNANPWAVKTNKLQNGLTLMVHVLLTVVLALITLKQTLPPTNCALKMTAQPVPNI